MAKTADCDDAGDISIAMLLDADLLSAVAQ